MRLDEITKDEFKRKLQDPAAQDLLDRVAHLNWVFHPYSFEAYGVDKETATVEFVPPRMSEEMPEANPVAALKNIIRPSEYWVWDTFSGDVEAYATAYVIRKT